MTIEIRVMTADSVSVSGPTVVCALPDEFAKFPGDDSAMPGRETVNSLRPALAPLKGAPRRRFLSITSAYIQEDIAYETDRDHFGKPDSPVLVVRGTTEKFNPNIDRGWLERERKRVGQLVFDREYNAIWQPAITEGWFGPVIEQCVDRNRKMTPYQQGQRYIAAIDAAFRGDRFALAIAHREHRPGLPSIVHLDKIMFWSAPRGKVLNVLRTVAECCDEIRDYGARTYADQFSFDPLKELFLRLRVHLHEAPWTSQTKANRFQLVRRMMADRLVRLPDHPELIRELHNIRGKLLRSGTEQLEGRAGHDDLAHAAVLAISQAAYASPDWGEFRIPKPEAIVVRHTERNTMYTDQLREHGVLARDKHGIPLRNPDGSYVMKPDL